MVRLGDDGDDDDDDAITVLEHDDDDGGVGDAMRNVRINTNTPSSVPTTTTATTTTAATTTAAGTTSTPTTMSQEQLQQMIDPSDAPRDTLRGTSFKTGMSVIQKRNEYHSNTAMHVTQKYE